MVQGGLLVMICGWFLMFAWYRDLPAAGHCLGVCLGLVPSRLAHAAAMGSL